MAVNDELGRKWKEVFMVYFKVLLQHVLAEIWKSFRIISFQTEN
jgi:hypothetical protein